MSKMENASLQVRWAAEMADPLAALTGASKENRHLRSLLDTAACATIYR